MPEAIISLYAERFYADPHKYALKLQLWILNQRYLTYVTAVKHVLETGMYVPMSENWCNYCLLYAHVVKLSQVKGQYWTDLSIATMSSPAFVHRRASSLMKVLYCNKSQ